MTNKETIERLRAALEFYADPRNYRNVVSILRKEDQPLNDDLTWLNIDSEYLPNFKANCGGVKARTALKECFGEEDGI